MYGNTLYICLICLYCVDAHAIAILDKIPAVVLEQFQFPIEFCCFRAIILT